MRISDWSSDGCSSDLLGIGGPGDLVIHLRRSPVAMQAATANTAACRARMGAMGRVPGRSKRCPHEFERVCEITRRRKAPPRRSATGPRDLRGVRSEEHTSELQSLMRISYAVFCLKKKKTQPMQST